MRGLPEPVCSATWCWQEQSIGIAQDLGPATVVKGIFGAAYAMLESLHARNHRTLPPLPRPAR